ncbi:MAG TPA: DUF2177 family protein [Saprospiraceae bacterium]|nr:DUF2177 family protein [Saprospiraceae bacterium]HMQ85341.1 DUF2177 family protein [Saprospiraceae bacterium]
MKFVKLYLLAIPCFFLLDMLWLGWIARPFYQRQMAPWISPKTDWLAAGLFYLLFLGGLVYFVLWLKPNDSAWSVLLRGAFFGLITYATYELTNKAVIQSWPWSLVVVDILWGVFLCAVTAWLCHQLAVSLQVY